MASSLLLVVLLAAGTTLCAGAPRADEYHRNHVKFYCYNKDTAHLKKGSLIPEELSKDSFLAAGYVPGEELKVLIHGFSSNVESDSMQLPKNAYFRKGVKNVCVVDWSFFNPAPLYFAGFGNIPGVAVRVAEILNFMVEQGLVSLDKVHLIGHSLGAHVAGVTAENLDKAVKRITGLDPARPFINMEKTDGRLSVDDAKLVDCIHTNAGTLGEQYASGHVDFYPNGGKCQPGCNFDFVGACSHGRSYHLFAESIDNPAAFEGWLCGDEWDALHKRCEANDIRATMGDQVTFTQPGSYYLETSDESPFATTA